MAVKRQLIFVWAGLLIAILAVLSLRHAVSVPRMPSYQGRTAQQWLGELLTTNQMQAFTAFREMGSNAMPVIIRALEKRDSAWDRFYYLNYQKLPASMRSRLARPMPDTQRWRAAEMAAVNGYGKASVPEFTRALAGANDEQERCVLSALINFLGPDDTNSVSGLIKCLKSHDANARWLAAVGLERIGPGAQESVAAITAALQDQDPAVRASAARAICSVAHQTNVAVMALKEIIASDQAPLVPAKFTAAQYLNELDPGDLSGVPVLIQTLEQPNIGFKVEAADALGGIGPGASNAIPSLVKLAQNNRPRVKQAARDALKKIDPPTAAKYENQ